MTAPRTLAIGGLALAAVAAAIAIGGPLGVGAGLVIATGARMIDGRGWFTAADRDARATVVIGGAIAGLVALGLALLVSAPLAELAERGVEWSTMPVVRGSIVQAATVAALVIAIGFAAELTLRRGLLELVAAALRRAGVGAGLALTGGVVAAAIVEAAIVPLDGDPVGIAVTSVGLGVMYVAAGRRLGASVSARVAFEVGAVVLQALRLVG